MTSTHTFQGLEADSKPSSRVLKPPGGGSSCIFGGPEEALVSSRQHKMASNIFGSAAEPENVPKRSNPPGGKTSGIFQDSGPARVTPKQNPPGGKTSGIFQDSGPAQVAPKQQNPPGGKTSGIFQDSGPVQSAPKQNPPGGKTSDIFGEAQLTTSPKAHPNKPKDNISLKQPEVSASTKPVKAEVKAEKPPPPPPAPTPEPTPEVKTPVAKEEKKVVMPEIDISRHEPHLGPRPRSHNRVLNPPGGKSSVTFY
ncbi:unnamed protein product [Staurois parvus]|uniref:Hematological and neurological expressed 1-like protein n=1 Tax=Staurois parvus TaxID=386267 RepID=A0ABN9DE92_9NEOB|nr:unnamed protein product [Staurois parvus]